MLDRVQSVVSTLNTILLGKNDSVMQACCCIFARGHLLIEDIPGVGKTTLAQALAKVLGLQLQRIQFTSDLLPADILGNTIFDKNTQQFTFRPGPMFSQVVLADEVNRASPKTQSALLEAMEEEQVSIDGQTFPLPQPFFVIATQNPGHQVGTFPLPESQLDRFMMKISIGFPGRHAERDMLSGQNRRQMIQNLEFALSPDELISIQKQVEEITVSDAIRDYVLNLLGNSRENPSAGLGLSPRAGLALQRAAQAWAMMQGRTMVLPEDIQAITPSVIGHRLESAVGRNHSEGRKAAQALIQSVAVS